MAINSPQSGAPPAGSRSHVERSLGITHPKRRSCRVTRVRFALRAARPTIRRASGCASTKLGLWVTLARKRAAPPRARGGRHQMQERLNRESFRDDSTKKFRHRQCFAHHETRIVAGRMARSIHRRPSTCSHVASICNRRASRGHRGRTSRVVIETCTSQGSL